MKNNVYVADIKTILPEFYDLEYIVDIVYSKELAGERIHELAKKSFKRFGIKNKPVVRSITKFPEKILSDEKNTPTYWGSLIIDEFTKKINVDEIGCLVVSYNVSSHKDTLPNLACQIALEKNLNLEAMPLEISNYGCASGVFSLKEAINYCSESNKAAVVFTFDQCSWQCDPIYDIQHPHFKANLKANLLFGDAAAGLLIIPESMRKRFNYPLMQIVDIQTDFFLGKEIAMSEGRFLVGNDVKDIMPELVSSKQIKPLLKRNKLSIEDIKEWSIHQGGLPVLDMFKEPEILGLSNEQISKSREAFEEYGNFSSPSCFFVLERYFKEHQLSQSNGKFGAIVGFGAGYYFGTMLYRWQS